MAKKTIRKASLNASPRSVRRTATVQERMVRTGARTKSGRAGAPSALPHVNLAQVAYDRIKAQIFDFILPPGGRFSENEIAARLGASRTPVREALYRLSREGFLEVYAKSGWRVLPLDFDRFEQLYDVRVILELAAARKLCESAATPDLDRLRQAWLVAPRARQREPHAIAAMDEAFHAALVAAAGNAELARYHAEITERIRIVRRLDFTQAERIDRTYDEHAAILRALLMRKTQQATLLLRAHIEASKLEVRKISLHRLHIALREGAERAASEGVTVRPAA
jgi:DNA-binding GntR family transcriptional regulator